MHEQSEFPVEAERADSSTILVVKVSSVSALAAAGSLLPMDFVIFSAVLVLCDHLRSNADIAEDSLNNPAAVQACAKFILLQHSSRAK